MLILIQVACFGEGTPSGESTIMAKELKRAKSYLILRIMLYKRAFRKDKEIVAYLISAKMIK